MYSAIRITGGGLVDQKLLFLGAGEAGTGIAKLVVSAMVAEGAKESDARRNCWFVDSKGLVESRRDGLAPHKIPFAHEADSQPDLISALRAIEPTAIIGVSGQPGTFTREVLEAMAQLNERPVVFALSNPTSKAECTAEDAYRWTGGRCVFASGSPFAPVTLEGRTFVPGQGNNAYIFPGVGLGVVATGATRVTDEMFLAAARTLAELVSEEDLASGSVYPPLAKIRSVSHAIAVAVARIAYERGLATRGTGEDLAEYVTVHMFLPDYPDYI